MEYFQEQLITLISSFYIHATLLIPHNKQKLVSEIHGHSNVLNVRYDEDGTYMECLFPKHFKHEVEKYIIEVNPQTDAEPNVNDWECMFEKPNDSIDCTSSLVVWYVNIEPLR